MVLPLGRTSNIQCTPAKISTYSHFNAHNTPWKRDQTIFKIFSHQLAKKFGLRSIIIPYFENNNSKSPCPIAGVMLDTYSLFSAACMFWKFSIKFAGHYRLPSSNRQSTSHVIFAWQILVSGKQLVIRDGNPSFPESVTEVSWNLLMLNSPGRIGKELLKNSNSVNIC